MPGLDALRGVAILLVLFHTFGVLETPSMPAHGVELFLDFGWVGVQLFFALSGFLITGILLDTRTEPRYYSSFFGRRVLRIFPLYYGALVFFFCILPAIQHTTNSNLFDRGHQVWLWLFLTNWVEPYGLGSRALSHFWSLAVEEQFYLVWPLLLRKRSPASTLRLCAVLMVVSLLVRIWMTARAANPEALYMFTVCRMDALAAGGAGAALLRIPGCQNQLEAWLSKVFIATASLVVLGAFPTHAYHRTQAVTQTLGYSLLAIASGVLIVSAAKNQFQSRIWRRLLASRALVTAGKYSFGMYVFGRPLHAIVGLPLLAALAPSATTSLTQNVVYILSCTSLAYALAYASYHLYESRFLGLKSHFSARPKAVKH